MFDLNRLNTNTLNNYPHAMKVKRILASALNAVDPSLSVKRVMSRQGENLKIAGNIYNLTQYKRVLIAGFGKASEAMGEAAAEILGNYLSEGILITKGPPTQHLRGISVFEGAHPVPDQRSIDGAQKIVDLLSTTIVEDLVICLISGGGSALLTLPVSGIALDDIQEMTQIMLDCGATINQINCLRKHLSQVKGGQLARLTRAGQIATLILSDVIGDPLDVIASGPMVPDPTTYSDAINILEKLSIINDVPESIVNHLKIGQEGKIQDTPKSDNFNFDHVHNAIIGNNYQASSAAIKQAHKEGFSPILLTTSLQGEARTAGKILASIIKQVASTGEPVSRPACIVVGGETTVTIRGQGLGGRNQELALAAVEDLSGIENVMMVSLATDGDDGPTDAAGAVVTGETLVRARMLGQDPSKHLANNSSYRFFDVLGDLLKPGLTGTNVNDLVFLITF